MALMAGQTTGVEERLQAAEAALQGAELNEQTRNLIGQIAAARATLALTRYEVDGMLTWSRRALEYLPPDNLPFRFTAYWTLSFACLLQGDRAAAKQACLEGLAISQKSGDVFSTVLASPAGELQEFDNQSFSGGRNLSACAAAVWRSSAAECRRSISGPGPHPLRMERSGNG